MKFIASSIVSLYLIFFTPSYSQSAIIETNNDWKSSSQGDTYWGYICQKTAYEVYFDFDLSTLPNESLTYLSFNAYMQSSSSTTRTLWNGSTLIGSAPVVASDAYSWNTITIDLDALNLQGEELITLTLTGPSDGSHYCGRVQLMESGNNAFLVAETSSVPEPSSIILLSSGLLGLLAYKRKNV